MGTFSADVLRWEPQVAAAAAQYKIPTQVLLAQIEQESGGNPAASSSAGAKGLTQFIPSTAQEYGVKYGSGQAETESQILGAAKYLSALGYAANPKLALEKYNGAPGSSESTSYAASILSKAGDNTETSTASKLKAIGNAVPEAVSGAKTAVEGTVSATEAFAKIAAKIEGWLANPLTPIKFVGGSILVYTGIRAIGGANAPQVGTHVKHAAELATVIAT